MKNPVRNSRGLSLIEILVALAIGSLLVLGLVEVFAASRAAYQMSEGLSRVQENGRFAMDYLMRDLRMVGHLGCVNDQARFLPENTDGARNGLISTFVTQADRDNDVYNNAPFALQFDASIRGYNANQTSPGNTLPLSANPAVSGNANAWTPALPTLPNGTNLAALAIPGSDVVALRYFSPTGAQVTGFTAGNPAFIDVIAADFDNVTDGIDDPGLFGVSDCATAAVFRANAIASGAPNTRITVAMDAINRSALDGNNSSNQFSTGQAMVYRAETVIYYVGIGTGGEPALFRMRFNIEPGSAAISIGPGGLPEELVQGVESLQLLYGVDQQTNPAIIPSGYMATSTPATATTVWDRVGLVQVGLVTRSPDAAAATQRADALPDLSALGVVITPPAGSTDYRTVYESSIAFRNRLFGN